MAPRALRGLEKPPVFAMPVVLPSKFPDLLVNGADGIAVGMATEIPPHNLREVCDAAIRIIDEPDVTSSGPGPTTRMPP